MKRHVRLAALAAVFALVTAACGDDDATTTTASAGGAGLAEAQAAVAAAMAPPTEFVAPGPAFDAASAAGSSVWYISYSQEAPQLQTWASALTEALEDYGVDVTVFDGRGQPTEFVTGIEQATAAGADVIFLLGIDPASVPAQVQEAVDAGIDIMVGSNGVPGIPDDPNVTAAVTINHLEVGRILGAWMYADAGGPFTAKVLSHPFVMGLQPYTDAIVDEVDRLCGPDCTVTVDEVPFTDIERLPEIGQNLILGDPDLGYIVPVYDWELFQLLSGVAEADPEMDVALGSFNAIGGVLGLIAGGTHVEADVGNPNAWFGYAMADQILRVLTGTDPVEDELIPLRLFTAGNIGDIDLDAGEETWYGNVDFRAGYRALWGDPAN